LAHYFMKRYEQAGKGACIVSAAEELLLKYSWPGNVRELDNLIQRALILKSGDGIEVGDIRFESEASVDAHCSYDSRIPAGPGASRLDDDLKSREQELILDALCSENGSRKQAAALLGISPRTLRYKLARLREEGVAIPN
jgi:two-component system response regulator FlrC